MRITVTIPSRGRIRGLSTILTSLQKLESGKHQVTYVIGCDDDDPQTRRFCESIKGHTPLVIKEGPRPKSLGNLVNELALEAPADVYTALCDDLLILWPYWDDTIAKAVETLPHGVFWWKNAHPMEATYAIVTEKWRKAAGGIFTNYYPFWFDDLDLLETWMMTTDMAPQVIDCVLFDKPEITLRMRDIYFWREFFIGTRILRKTKAFMIAKNLGLNPPQKVNDIAYRLSIGLERMSIEKLAAIERTQGDMGAPDASYLEAKRQACLLLADLATLPQTETRYAVQADTRKA